MAQSIKKLSLNLAKCGLGLLTLAALTGCGASSSFNVGAADEAATGASTTASTSTSDAECNSFSSLSGATMNGRVTTYYYNGVLQTNLVRVRLTGIDAQFTLNPNVTMQMYRWKADSSGNITVDNNPLAFDFEAGTGATSAFSNSMISLNFAQLASLNSAGGINAASAAGFFADTTMVVGGLDTSWQALRIVLSNGVTAIGQVDILLPAFISNPNEYGATHPSVLNNLHPFWSMRAQANSDATWTSETKAFCF